VSGHRSSISLFLLAGLGVAAHGQSAALPRVELQVDRDFGYTIGSIIEQRLIVDLPRGASLEADTLPTPGPVNEWLDLRAIRWQERTDQRWELAVAYLVLKGVRNPEPASIPPLVLGLRQGTATAQLQTPEWPFTLMPVIPPAIPDEKVAIRGPLPAPSFSLRTQAVAMAACLLGAAAGAAVAAVRLGLLPWFRENRPFARTFREVRKLSRRAKEETGYAAALQLVHQAIDETLGCAVFPALIGEFFARKPAFLSLRTEFESFFLSSQRYFFDTGIPDRALDERWRELEDFCRCCAKAERGAG